MCVCCFFSCFFVSVPVRRKYDGQKAGNRDGEEKKKNRWECKYYIDVFFFFFSFKLDLFFAFVHGHGAQFLLSQMRFTYDVFNG
ncbi:Uncharacterized protein APZ42_003321, partial [Daphnia magna]